MNLIDRDCLILVQIKEIEEEIISQLVIAIIIDNKETCALGNSFRILLESVARQLCRVRGFLSERILELLESDIFATIDCIEISIEIFAIIIITEDRIDYGSIFCLSNHIITISIEEGKFVSRDLIKQECGYFLLICSRNYSKSMFISL
jgi:hypothetical protein